MLNKLKDNLKFEIEQEFRYFFLNIEEEIESTISDCDNKINDLIAQYTGLSLSCSKSKSLAVTIIERICDKRIVALNQLKEIWTDDKIKELVLNLNYNLIDNFKSGDWEKLVNSQRVRDSLALDLEKYSLDEESFYDLESLLHRKKLKSTNIKN